ncbi:hypothetical protein ABZ958_03415 [Streptomyces sp. NPDC046237]|uniref:hypothetical protein n=1 Tax=Streptomyces sp. NPDC046237 TaxID=3154914 RepID=UPI0033EAD018
MTDMEKQGTHFWFMTIQNSSAASGTTVGDYQGTISPPRGTTRFDLFNKLRAEIEQRYPQAVDGVVVAFDVQPNKL